MPAPRVRADYEQLQQISSTFQQQADGLDRGLQQMKRQMNVLQGGDWIGVGATKFYSEMTSQVFPAMQRMVNALRAAGQTTANISRVMKAAEDGAAAVFKLIASAAAAGLAAGGAATGGGTSGSGDSSGGGSPSGGGSGSGSGGGSGVKTPAFSLAKFLATKAASGLFMLFKERNAIRALLQGGVRFKMVDGMWRAYGSQAAKQALGLGKNFTRFGQAAIDKSMGPGAWQMIKSLVAGEGTLLQRAKSLLSTIKEFKLTNSPLGAAQSFGKAFKGAAIVGSLITIGSNIYDFAFGANKDLGLGSRQFFTTTGADLIAGGGIIAASTAIGTLIPIPGVGTAAGFLVGVGLQFAYDKWGKEAWRGAVDTAAQAVGEWAPKAWDATAQFGRDVARGAGDVINSIGNGVSSFFNKIPRPSFF